MLKEIVSAPETLLALAVVLAGAVVWSIHRGFLPIHEWLNPVGTAAAQDFSFE